MKKIFLCLAAIAVFWSCQDDIIVNGNGSPLPYYADVSNSTTSIEIHDAIELILTNDLDEGKLLVETQENIYDYVKINSSDNKLVIELKNGYVYRDHTVKIYASLNQFENFEAAGASSVLFDGMKIYDNVKLKLSGASTFEGNLVCKRELIIDLSGASEAKLYGAAKDCELILSGASNVDGINFSTEELMCDFSGASEASITVTDEIRGELSGASALNYNGKARVEVNLSGSSTIKRIQ